eukprot:m.17239 g.17239  ORF g.17239 m.17239 type:complete len:86 (+) comp27394_c0_seq1:263-520(+)
MTEMVTGVCLLDTGRRVKYLSAGNDLVKFKRACASVRPGTVSCSLSAVSLSSDLPNGQFLAFQAFAKLNASAMEHVCKPSQCLVI